MDLISKEDAVALIKAEMDKIRTHSLVDGTARINLRLAKNIIEDMPSIDSEFPNNSTISKMEQVDKDINVRSKDEPQTDCPWK